MSDNIEKSKSTKTVVIATPIIVLVICAALAAIMCYFPVRKAETLMNIAFSANPDHAQISEIKYDTKEVEAEIDGNKIVYPSFGAEYAALKIDSINLEAPVFWGSSEELLKQGVCQYSGSVFIGEQGNVVRDAHCNTYFYELGNVKEGDIVTLTTSYGEFTYKAKEQVLFKDTDNKYISPTADDRLTLYTCYGNLLGPTEDRLAVICELVEKKFYE